MGKVWAALQIISELIKLIKQIFGMVDAANDKKAAEKTEALNTAVDASKVAQTDEEIFKSQQDIVENKS